VVCCCRRRRCRCCTCAVCGCVRDVLLLWCTTGTLDEDEVRQLALELGDDSADPPLQPLTDAQLAEAMAEMDADGNGSVDFEEFWAWWQDRLAGKDSKSSAFGKALFQSKALSGELTT
jgi:hypothetical protein